MKNTKINRIENKERLNEDFEQWKKEDKVNKRKIRN